MNQPLDLTIMLTPPPQGSPPEIIASITLRCDALGSDHSGDLLRDPLTQRDRTDLHWYLEEYWKWPYLEFAARGKEVEALLIDVGKRLYRTIFSDDETQVLLQQWQEQTNYHHQISIVSTLPRVLSLPWELLHDEQGFLALRSDHPISIVRRLPHTGQSTLTTSFKLPLRILLITARPDGAGFVDPRSISRELLDEVQEHIDIGIIEMEFLRPATLAALRARLEDTQRPVHIVHFDGHGTFDEQKGKGLLAFENANGRLAPVNGAELARILGNRGIRLAVLTACQTAKSSAQDAFSSVATQLLQGGIDAVVAMSAGFLVTSAVYLVEAFYHTVASSSTISMAQEQARSMLYNKPQRHLSHRYLDEEGVPVKLHDWWVPHLYQQRPVLALVAQGRHVTKQQMSESPDPRLSEEMPVQPRYGFSGRARELLRIERALLHGKLVLISGFGGIGKTALAREAAEWLIRTKMYDAAHFVSFEHGGDATWLLSNLCTHLNIYDEQYNLNDPEATLARLAPILKGQRKMILVDNLESILPEGDAPLETVALSQLWDVLLQLSKLGAGILLTSRNQALGDKRMKLKSVTAHLELKGLNPEDAYRLTSRLLDDLGVDRSSIPYPGLRDLLVQLDHHPLSIQLVLSRLQNVAFPRIMNDIAELLPMFVDETEAGHNRSLLASLDYSLQRLTGNQRALLPRLAPFEGGANKNTLLRITEIAEDDWTELHLALERAGLMRAERIHEDLTVPFLHFHPTLGPYLRSQQSTRDPILYERYASSYHALANYLHSEDMRNAQAVRRLFLRELPNLQKALALLLEAGVSSRASEMAHHLIRFLTFLGLWKERDKLRQKIREAIATNEFRTGGELTQAQWAHELGLGDDESRKGNLGAALARFAVLLQRIEALPEGAPVGRGSFAHGQTLLSIGACLAADGNPTAAEEQLLNALAVSDELLRQHPDDRDFLHMRAGVLSELGTALHNQGKYPQAQAAFGEALEIDTLLGDQRSQAVELGKLGRLSRAQGEYTKAEFYYTLALEMHRKQNYLPGQAEALHQLGIIAEEQGQSAQAEQYYRGSLALEVQQDNAAGAAVTCSQLGNLAQFTGRFDETENWYKQALEFEERVQKGSSAQARYLNNLATVLVNRVLLEDSHKGRLLEAQNHAKQALSIMEKLDASSGIWSPLSILAHIADMEGRAEEARQYRRRERESFAAFAGNRYDIDQRGEALIIAIANAAKGDIQARAKVLAYLPQLEEDGWPVASAIARIWAGERDWHSLSDGIDRNSALLVLRVLETLAQ